MTPWVMLIVGTMASVFAGYRSHSTLPGRNVFHISGILWIIQSIIWGGMALVGMQAISETETTMYFCVLFGAAGYCRAMQTYKRNGGYK